MFLFKLNFVCGLGREQNFVLSKNYDQLLAFFFMLNHYLHEKHCIFVSILLTTYKRILLRLLLYLIDLKSNITRQQIDAKIQCFHVIDLKKLFHTYIDLLLYSQK